MQMQQVPLFLSRIHQNSLYIPIPKSINITHHPIRCLRSRLSRAAYLSRHMTYTPVSVFLFALSESVSC